MQRVIKILEKLGIPFHQWYDGRVIIDNGIEPCCIYWGPFFGEYFSFMHEEGNDPSIEASDPKLETWIKEYVKGHDNFEEFLREDSCKEWLKNLPKRINILSNDYETYIKKRNIVRRYPNDIEKCKEAFKKEINDGTAGWKLGEDIWEKRVTKIEKAISDIEKALCASHDEDLEEDIPF